MPSIIVGDAIAVAPIIIAAMALLRVSLRCHGSTAQNSGRIAGCQGANGQISPSGPIRRPGHIQLQSQLNRHQRARVPSKLPGQAQPISQGMPDRRRCAPSNSNCRGRGHIQAANALSHNQPATLS